MTCEFDDGGSGDARQNGARQGGVLKTPSLTQKKFAAPTSSMYGFPRQVDDLCIAGGLGP